MSLRSHCLWSVASVVSAYIALCATPAAAGLVTVDDFTNDTLSDKYAVSTVLTTGSPTGTVIFDTTTNLDKLTFRFEDPTGSAIQQTVLRNDVGLVNQDDYIQVTVTIPSAPIGSSPTNLFGGLAIDGLTKTPTTRAQNFNIQIDGSRRVFVEFNGSKLSGATTGGGLFAFGDEVHLRITRLSSTSAQASYSLNGTTFVNLGAPQTVAGFAAFGLMAGNARANAVGTVVYDNLMLNTVPEPSSAIALALGLSGICAFRIRRRRVSN